MRPWLRTLAAISLLAILAVGSVLGVLRLRDPRWPAGPPSQPPHDAQRWLNVTYEGAAFSVPIEWTFTRARGRLAACTEVEPGPGAIVWPQRDRPLCRWPEDPASAPLTVHASSLGTRAARRPDAGVPVRSAGGVLGRSVARDGVQRVTFPDLHLTLTLNWRADPATARTIVDSVRAAGDGGHEVRAGELRLTLPSTWRRDTRDTCAGERDLLGADWRVTVFDSSGVASNCLADLKAWARPAVVVFHAPASAWRGEQPGAPGRRAFISGHEARRIDRGDTAFFIVKSLDAVFAVVRPDHPLLESVLATAWGG